VLKRLRPRPPIPTQIVSNGEYLPPTQSETQRRVERRILELADANRQAARPEPSAVHANELRHGRGLPCDERDYGANVFQVEAAEAHEPELMLARQQSLSGQLIFDVQTHFVRDDFEHKELLHLGDFASEHWHPRPKGEPSSLVRYKFQNYVKEIYYDSEHPTLALLSGPLSTIRAGGFCPTSRSSGLAR